MSLLAPVLQEYFTAHLVAQRAMSPATIRTYRDTWRLFLTFVSDKTHVPAHRLETAHVDQAQMNAFLDYLEHQRGNSVATRNLRLAAIKGLMGSLENDSSGQGDPEAEGLQLLRQPGGFALGVTGVEIEMSAPRSS